MLGYLPESQGGVIRETGSRTMRILRKPRYQVLGELEPFDERDNVQARREIQPNTVEYQEFYQRHPEWEEKDREIRALPGIMRVGNPLDIPFLGEEIAHLFRYGQENLVDAPVSRNRYKLSPQKASAKVKGFARHLGADLVRLGPLNPGFVYTHLGKPRFYEDRKIGAPITLPHKSAISIAIGMNPNMIRTGPVLAEIVEVLRVYGQLAMISVALAGYIRAIGYPARAHNIFNYQILCIPVAIDAGMGELGRHGLLITKELGSCLKIATVTTDLPLIYDSPIDIGIDEFCQDCKICAENCPSGSISYGEKKAVRGVNKWCIKPETCFKVWNETGTDCGICMASCPWTKPTTPFHNFAKQIATRKMKAGWWMSRAEKLVYGRFRPKPSPGWLEEPEPIWRKYKTLRQ